MIHTQHESDININYIWATKKMNMNRMKWCKRKKCIECHTQWMNFLNEKGEDKTEQQQQKI